MQLIYILIALGVSGPGRTQSLAPIAAILTVGERKSTPAPSSNAAIRYVNSDTTATGTRWANTPGNLQVMPTTSKGQPVQVAWERTRKGRVAPVVSTDEFILGRVRSTPSTAGRATSRYGHRAVEADWVLARPRTARAALTRSLATTPGQQVAAHMTYPEPMRQSNQGGIVVITFSVSDDNCLSQLRVHTDNQALNEDITRQLVGRKIRLAESNLLETYTVRLRFVP